MARLVLPSRLELNRPEGSEREAPLANVIFTTAFHEHALPFPQVDLFAIYLLEPGMIVKNQKNRRFTDSGVLTPPGK